MALFIAFFVGALIALLFPGITSNATENGKAFRQRLSGRFRTTLSRAVAFLLALGLLVYLHYSHTAAQAIAFLLATLLAVFITDYILTPGKNDTARLMLLAGTAGLLVVLAIFPPDYLRRSLTRFNIGGVSIELLQAAPEPPANLPGATLVQTEGHRDRDIGLTSLTTIANRLRSFEALLSRVERDSPTHEGYPSEAVKEVFNNFLIPLARCAGAAREWTISNSRDLVFDSHLA